MKEEKKHILMAQTTPDASFGPIFVIAAHFLCQVPVVTIVVVHSQSVKKNWYNIEKSRKMKHTWLETQIRLEPLSSSSSSSFPSLCWSLTVAVVSRSKTSRRLVVMCATRPPTFGLRPHNTAGYCSIAAEDSTFFIPSCISL